MQRYTGFSRAGLLVVTTLLLLASLTASADPTLTLTSPNGGESWCVGSLQTITWNSSEVSSVDIFISANDGSGFGYLVTGATGNSHPWYIPENQPAGTRYRIMIRESGGTVADTGDYFTINTAPEVLTDQSDIVIPAWETTVLRATAGGSPTPDIEWQVSTDGGGSWNRVTGNTAVGVDSEKLTLYFVAPSMNGNLYRARFTNICATAVTRPAKLSVVSVRILEPNGGETLCAGSSQRVTWSMQGYPATATYYITYSPDSGGTWRPIGTVVGDTSIVWNIAPSEPPSRRNILRVTTQGVVTSDSTDRLFTVNSIPSVSADPADTTQKFGRLAGFTARAYGVPVAAAEWQVSTDGGGSWISFGGSTDSAGDDRVATKLIVPAVSESSEPDLYRVVFTNSCGADTTQPAALTIIKDPTVGVEREERSWGLIALAPNPALHEARLSLRLRRPAPVRIRVVDARGETTLLREIDLGTGDHIVTLNTGTMPSGTYRCEVTADGVRMVETMMVVR